MYQVPEQQGLHSETISPSSPQKRLLRILKAIFWLPQKQTHHTPIPFPTFLTNHNSLRGVGGGNTSSVSNQWAYFPKGIKVLLCSERYPHSGLCSGNPTLGILSSQALSWLNTIGTAQNPCLLIQRLRAISSPCYCHNKQGKREC